MHRHVNALASALKPHRRHPHEVLLDAISAVSINSHNLSVLTFPIEPSFREIHTAICWMQQQSARAFAIFLGQTWKRGSWKLRVETVQPPYQSATDGYVALGYKVYSDSADHTLQLCFHRDNHHAGPGQDAALAAFYLDDLATQPFQDVIAESVNRLCGTGFFGNGGAIASIDGQVVVTSPDPYRPWQSGTDVQSADDRYDAAANCRFQQFVHNHVIAN